MNETCNIHDQDSQPVLSIRTVTSVENLPTIIGESYAEIMRYLEELGEELDGIPFVAYYNMDMHNLEVEIGMPVSRPLAGKGKIQANELPAGKYASCSHVGPYQEIGQAYEDLTKFVEENGYTPSGIAYEYYLNSPNEVQDTELVTRLSFLLK